MGTSIFPSFSFLILFSSSASPSALFTSSSSMTPIRIALIILSLYLLPSSLSSSSLLSSPLPSDSPLSHPSSSSSLSSSLSFPLSSSSISPSLSGSSLLEGTSLAVLPPVDLVFPFMHLASEDISVSSTSFQKPVLSSPSSSVSSPSQFISVSEEVTLFPFTRASSSHRSLQTFSSSSPISSVTPADFSFLETSSTSLLSPASSSSGTPDKNAREAAVQELLHRHRLKQAEQQLAEIEGERRRQQELQDEVARRADAELAAQDEQEHKETLRVLETEGNPRELEEYRQALARAVLDSSQRQRQMEGHLQLHEIKRQLQSAVDVERQRQEVLRRALIAKTGRDFLNQDEHAGKKTQGGLSEGGGHGVGGGGDGTGVIEEDSDDDTEEEDTRRKRSKALARGEVILEGGKGKWRRLKTKLKEREDIEKGNAATGEQDANYGGGKEDQDTGGFESTTRWRSEPKNDDASPHTMSEGDDTSSGREEEENKKELQSSTKPQKKDFFRPITRLFSNAFRSLRSFFTRSRVDEAATKVNSLKELSAEYLRCLNIGNARSNFKRGEAYCHRLSSNSHRRFCSGLVQMAMQLLEDIRNCQQSRRGTHRRACFFTVKAPLMHPTLMELMPNPTEQYIEGFLTRSPNFQVVSLATEKRIDQHMKALDWRGILRHSFDTVTIAASNRLWRETADQVQRARRRVGGLSASRKSRNNKKRRTIESIARRFHETQREILEMGPHADPLFVGLLHAIVYEDNACQSRPDYGARIVRVVRDRQITTSVKEQAKIAFVRFIQSLYSIEECASPPFLLPYEMEDDENSSSGALPTGADGDDEDQEEGLETSPSSTTSTGGTPETSGVHGANQTHSRPSALRRMQNCELVRRLFNKSLDGRQEEDREEEHNNPAKQKRGREDKRDGGDHHDDGNTTTTARQKSHPRPSLSSGDQLGEGEEGSGDEADANNSGAVERSSESTPDEMDIEKERERYLTPLQKKERKEFVKYLNAFVTSQATLTAAVALSTPSKTYKVMSFLVRSKVIANLLVKLASKFVPRVLKLSRIRSSFSSNPASATGVVTRSPSQQLPPTSGSLESFPYQQGLWSLSWSPNTNRRGSSSYHGDGKKTGMLSRNMDGNQQERYLPMLDEAPTYVLGIGAVAEILSGQESVGQFAVQLMRTALKTRQRQLKRLAARRERKWAFWRWGKNASSKKSTHRSDSDGGTGEDEEAALLKGGREGEEGDQSAARGIANKLNDDSGNEYWNHHAIEETPEIKQAKFLARLFTSVTAVFAGILLLVTTGAWTIPVLLAVGIVAVSLMYPEEEEAVEIDF
ncbi:transmembrane protein [Cystoisospora suis]|uniref:Transmembrane protein n=1 Tax=Cystoisospora suis TaxID=483139 RepID=A0A2C6L728_9APIC|nr:transmembrane protein [Cystoisospora suis]